VGRRGVEVEVEEEKEVEVDLFRSGTRQKMYHWEGPRRIDVCDAIGINLN
jgi:hypothetical protein